MRGRAVIVLVGFTALIAYSLGRQDAPAGKQSPAVVISPPAILDKPVALVAGPMDAAASPKPQAAAANPTESIPQPKPSSPTGPSQPDIKRKGEVAVTVAAIAAIIVQASRNQYYATGHPCACPDDLMRNGQRCGGRSAYSRPGGAAPLCYPQDVTQAMIEEYRLAVGSGAGATRGISGSRYCCSP